LVKYFERDSEGNEAGLIYCGCFSRGVAAGTDFWVDLKGTTVWKKNPQICDKNFRTFLSAVFKKSLALLFERNPFNF
jgi:hypothetical protein